MEHSDTCPDGTHWHCIIPDCAQPFEDFERGFLPHLETHPVNEWASNLSWVQDVMMMTYDLLHEYHPEAYQHVMAEVEQMRGFMDRIYGSGRN